MNPIRTLEEAEAAERAARERFEADTVAFYSDGEPVTMAEARAVFDAVLHVAAVPPADWKRGFAVAVSANRVGYYSDVIEFYHGARPTAAPGSSAAVRILTTFGYVC